LQDFETLYIGGAEPAVIRRVFDGRAFDDQAFDGKSFDGNPSMVRPLTTKSFSGPFILGTMHDGEENDEITTARIV
jgi:hypothetical protein